MIPTKGNVKLYSQRKTVSDQPNPPVGKYSVHHNRKEGYADYKIGYFYISPDDLTLQGLNIDYNSSNNNCEITYLYYLDKYGNDAKRFSKNKNHSINQFKQKRGYKSNIPKKRYSKQQSNDDNQSVWWF